MVLCFDFFNLVFWLQAGVIQWLFFFGYFDQEHCEGETALCETWVVKGRPLRDVQGTCFTLFFFLVINYTCNIVRLNWKAEWIIVLFHMELCYVSPLPPFAPFTHMNQMCQWDLGISFERYWVAILKHNLSFLVRQKRNLFFINLRY